MIDDKESYWPLFAVLCAAAIFGITFGLTFPLLTIVMRQWGVSESLIGLNSAMPGLAALILSFVVPALMQRYGARRMMGGFILVFALCLITYPALPYLGAWFILRFIGGAAQIGIFIVSEILVTQLAPDNIRGRIVGLYSMMVSVGFAIGALLLSVTGTEGATPFYIGCAIILFVAIPYMLVSIPEQPAAEKKVMNITTTMRAAPAIALCAMFSGILYTGVTALLPVYAMGRDSTPGEAATYVAWLAAGSVCLPPLIGYFADRIKHLQLLAYICLLMVVCAVVLHEYFANYLLRSFSLFVIGGVLIGIYSLALTMIGSHFKGAVVAAAIAGMTFMFSLGEMLGPILIGLSMEINNTWFIYSLVIASLLTIVGTLALQQAVRKP